MKGSATFFTSDEFGNLMSLANTNGTTERVIDIFRFLNCSMIFSSKSVSLALEKSSNRKTIITSLNSFPQNALPINRKENETNIINKRMSDFFEWFKVFIQSVRLLYGFTKNNVVFDWLKYVAVYYLNNNFWKDAVGQDIQPAAHLRFFRNLPNLLGQEILGWNVYLTHPIRFRREQQEDK